LRQRVNLQGKDLQTYHKFLMFLLILVTSGGAYADRSRRFCKNLVRLLQKPRAYSQLVTSQDRPKSEMSQLATTL